MPGPLPTSRPVFLDEELRNGNFATPTLLRKMIDWCRFSYARDLPFLPNDPVGPRITEAADGTLTAPTLAYQTSVAQTWWKPFGSFYVPDPLGPARRLNVQVYVGQSALIPGFTEVVSATYPVEILLTSNRGLSQVLTVTASGGWSNFTVPAAPDSIVTIQARSGNATDIEKQSGAFLGICAHWEEPSALVPGMSVDTTGIPLPSQAFPAQNRALSVVLLRNLARWMNRFTARTCRQVVAKWFEAPVRAPTGAVAGVALSQYRVWVSDGCGSLQFEWSASWSAPDAELVITVPGEGAVTEPLGASSATLAVTPGPGRLETIQVSYNVSGGGTFILEAFQAFEQPIASASIPLPAGESFPIALPVLARDRIRAESSIVASGETGLLDVLQAQRFVIKTRQRSLVKDAGLVPDRVSGLTAGGADAGVQQKVRAWTPTIGITHRLRSGVHGRSTASALPASASFQVFETDVVGGLGVPVLVQDVPFAVTAEKASVDSVDAANATLQPSPGQKVVQWPAWMTADLAAPGIFGPLNHFRLTVNQTDGLYEAEWAGGCIERFIPEADVP